MQSNLTLTASFVPTPFPVVSGSYTGLAVNTNEVRPDNSGFFRVSVTSMGQFSGRVLSEGKGYGFHGQFDLAGDAAVTVKRGLLSPLTVAMHLNLTHSSDQVTGTLSADAWELGFAGRPKRV